VPSSNHVWVVANRRARHLRSAGPLLHALDAPGVRFVATTSLEELGEAARAIEKAKPDAVILAGGDGSYMEGLTALSHAFGRAPLPRLGFAPGGTVSTVAHNWGLRGDPVQYTHSLVLSARGGGRTTPRPTLRVGTRVGFIFGTGLVARFFEAYRGTGRLEAARLVARVFAGSFVGSTFARTVLAPMPCAIEVDGVTAPFHRVSLLCASVVKNLGLGMRLLPRAGELDRFHVVATPLSPLTLGPQMPLVLAGRPLLGPKVDALARLLEVRFPKTDAYVLDGDLFRDDVVEVTPGPTIEVLTP
jgi:diacylglycerol kinase (ATP)